MAGPHRPGKSCLPERGFAAAEESLGESEPEAGVGRRSGGGTDLPRPSWLRLVEGRNVHRRRPGGFLVRRGLSFGVWSSRTIRTFPVYRSQGCWAARSPLASSAADSVSGPTTALRRNFLRFGLPACGQLLPVDIPTNRPSGWPLHTRSLDALKDFGRRRGSGIATTWLIVNSTMPQHCWNAAHREGEKAVEIIYVLVRMTPESSKKYNCINRLMNGMVFAQTPKTSIKRKGES
jgi:hypothetical protein